MNNATPLTESQCATSRRAAERLELAYLCTAIANLVDLLDARDALLRDLVDKTGLGDGGLEWTDLVAAWEQHDTATTTEVLSVTHRLMQRTLGI